MAVVGSGIMATNLTDNVALQLLINAIATVAMLHIIITLFAKSSGAHFNPAVTLAALLNRQVSFTIFMRYLVAQFAGGIAGTLLANAMFNLEVVQHAHTARFTHGTFIGEVVATFGLLLVITLKPKRAAILVPAWIASAYFFTSSTSFANPAVTIARSFTDTFSGIASSSIPGFVGAQIVGLVLALLAQPLLSKEAK